MRDSNLRWLPIVAATVVSFGLAACTGGSHETAEDAGEAGLAGEDAAEQATPESMSERASAEEAGEHASVDVAGEHAEGGEGEHAEGGEGEEEESGVEIAAGDTWDATRNGARLVLSFDAVAGAFTGHVENTTEATLCAVRVEVHLSTATELGPTERTDVTPGASISVRLPTEGETFESWTAHPEISPCGV